MDTRFSSFSRRAVALALVLGLAACAETTPRWDSSFGATVRSTFAAQVVNPGAARNTNPAAGIDGRSARAAHEQYERASAQPQSEPASLMSGSGTK